MSGRLRAAWHALLGRPAAPPPSRLDFAFGGTVWPGLAKFQEESCEVGQVLAKLIQTGGDPEHWSGNMVEKLVEEMPDLLASYYVFFMLNPVLHSRADEMTERARMKVRKFLEWHFDTLGARG